ncbi:MAG: hypothetical protein IJ553_06165 [Alloprevotella sp.]|nr:hypothetical protein [Alloprevotella sp.]
MKTTEEKAKAYDEAIERAKESYKVCGHDFDAELEYIFPELCESEDEGIRKAVKNALILKTSCNSLTHDGVMLGDAIAWLEKQKDRPTEMKSAEESLGISSEDYNKIVDRCIYGVQKLAESEDERIRNTLIKHFKERDSYRDEDETFTGIPFIDVIAWLEKQKPAKWNEEDEEMFRRCLSAMFDHGYLKEFDWLESLRPQKQCGYNPYKAVVESIAEMCRHYDKASHSALRDFYDNVKVKCKDAKEYDAKYPQKRWKPSEEQMKALKLARSFVTDDFSDNPTLSDVLKSLYNDLKQL